MIRFEQVGKTYPGSAAPAVRGVSLEVARGEVVALVGASGCGKTTLLKMVNRLTEPDTGRVYVTGAPVSGMEVRALRRRIGYAGQSAGLLPHLCVESNVALPLRADGISKAGQMQAAQEALQLAGLDASLWQRLPSELSGGQRQRVSLARALVRKPAVLLLDEPFSALDAITRQELQRSLKKLCRGQNLTALLVTHDLLEAMYLGSRVAVMNQGRVEQCGAPEEVLHRPATPYVRALTECPALEVLRRG